MQLIELLSSGYWPEIVNASNSSGFSSLPSGWKYTGFSEINLGTHLWTRTEYDAPRGHSFYLNEGTNWQFNHVGAGKFLCPILSAASKTPNNEKATDHLVCCCVGG